MLSPGSGGAVANGARDAQLISPGFGADALWMSPGCLSQHYWGRSRDALRYRKKREGSGRNKPFFGTMLFSFLPLFLLVALLLLDMQMRVYVCERV